jgi:hypothetical protein
VLSLSKHAPRYRLSFTIDRRASTSSALTVFIQSHNDWRM